MIDWDDAFDNSGNIANATDYFEVWTRKADAARTELTCEMNVAYGDHPRENIDLFRPKDPPKGLVIFVHGGYWHLLDKSYFSHLAKGAVGNGLAVAMISYPLAPEVGVSQITSSVAQAVEHAATLVNGPLRLVGHSAGGHLVSRMICDDTQLSNSTLDRIKKVISISGVHDLRPLVETKMNLTLKLSPQESIAESPGLRAQNKNIPIHFWVGAEERPEFLRQTGLIAEAWQRAGGQVGVTYEAGHHHFSVVEDLEFENSALTRELLAP